MAAASGIDDSHHYTEGKQADHIVERHHLQQHIYIIALGMILSDGHHGARRCGSRGDCAQNQAEIPGQVKNQPHAYRNKQAGQQRFPKCNGYHLPARFH